MRVTAAAAVVFVLALTGCASAGEPAGDADTPPRAEPVLTQPLVPLTAPEVLEYCPAGDAVHFDGNADIVDEVFVCTAQLSAASDGAQTELVQRIVDWEDELLTLYSEPNEFATTEVCIQLAPDPLILWLHRGDDVTPVYAPVDECGFPTDIAVDAYESAEFETVLEVEIDETNN